MELYDSDTGANVQEVADPATTGANEREPAAPAGVTEQTTATDAEDSGSVAAPAEGQEEAADQDEGGSAPEQTPEQRRRFAEMRRRQEEAVINARLEAERRAAQAKVDRTYAEMFAGKNNPYTGKPILNEADYNEYRKQYEVETARDQLKKSGITEQAINSVIERHPAVLQAQQALKEAEAAKTAARELQAREGLQNELKVISALDPSIKTMEDLTRMPSADKFFETVKRGGVTLSEAFKLVNFDALQGRRIAAAKQAGAQQAASKGHLTASEQRGGGAATIPPDVLELYREMNPGVSAADIEKHWAKHNRN